MCSKTNNANGVKNSSSLAVKEQMKKNVVNYIKSALAIDEPELKVTDIDEEYGILEISNDCWKVQMSFDGTLCEFLTEDVWLDIENLEAIATIMHNQNDIITAMFENVEAA